MTNSIINCTLPTLWDMVQAVAPTGESHQECLRRYMRARGVWANTHPHPFLPHRELLQRMVTAWHAAVLRRRAARMKLQRWLNPIVRGWKAAHQALLAVAAIAVVQTSAQTSTSDNNGTVLVNPPKPTRRQATTKHFGLSPPIRWPALYAQFQQHKNMRWNCNMREFLSRAFVFMHTRRGNHAILTAMLRHPRCTLTRMQNAEVWLRCELGGEDVSAEVVVFRQGVITPTLHLGACGVLRIPLTVRVKERWSPPVWLDVGSVKYAAEYYDHMRQKWLHPAASKLTRLILECQKPLLSQCVTYFGSIGKAAKTSKWLEQRHLQFIRMMQRQSLQQRVLPTELAGLFTIPNQRYILSLLTTQRGNQSLFEMLFTVQPLLTDLVLGHVYVEVKLIPDDANHCSLNASVKRRPSHLRVLPNTLGGVGPCSVLFLFANEPDSPLIRVNLNALPYARCPRWVGIMYVFLSRHVAVIVETVSKWVRKKLVQK